MTPCYQPKLTNARARKSRHRVHLPLALLLPRHDLELERVVALGLRGVLFSGLCVQFGATHGASSACGLDVEGGMKTVGAVQMTYPKTISEAPHEHGEKRTYHSASQSSS